MLKVHSRIAECSGMALEGPSRYMLSLCTFPVHWRDTVFLFVVGPEMQKVEKTFYYLGKVITSFRVSECCRFVFALYVEPWIPFNRTNGLLLFLGEIWITRQFQTMFNVEMWLTFWYYRSEDDCAVSPLDLWIAYLINGVNQWIQFSLTLYLIVGLSFYGKKQCKWSANNVTCY